MFNSLRIAVNASTLLPETFVLQSAVIKSVQYSYPVMHFASTMTLGSFFNLQYTIGKRESHLYNSRITTWFKQMFKRHTFSSDYHLTE